MRVVDLFAGCGGLSLGFQNAGFNIVAAYEFWDKAIQAYTINFDHPVFNQDLSRVEESVDLIGEWNPDVIMGGPPCQEFSHAGKRTEGDRANLTQAYGEIVFKVRPRWFVMENVDRSQNSKAYSRARELFKSAGYGLTERVLDASRCGVPQKRKRFFCIGLLHAEDGFLNSMINDNMSDRPMTVRDYMGDELDVGHYYRHPRNYSRRAVFSIDEPAPTVRGVNRPVPAGYPGHANDTAPVAEGGIRSLTTLERSRLQTFPRSYQWPELPKTTLEQMIGNAVPVGLGEFVANMIRQYELAGTTETEALAIGAVE